jgi:hypothetical protein
VSDLSALSIPTGIDGARLLDAIAAVETSRGANNWPRVEAGWVPKGVTLTIQGRLVVGRYPSGIGAAVVATRWTLWGIGSAASWGRWQILFHTAADLGYRGAPWALHEDDIGRPWVIARLNKISNTGAATVEDFADAWNSGTYRDSIVPVEYIAAVSKAYREANPDEATT